MSQKVEDIYTHKDFDDLLTTAEANTANAWGEDFVADMRAKFEEYGIRAYLSEAQDERLNAIAGNK